LVARLRANTAKIRGWTSEARLLNAVPQVDHCRPGRAAGLASPGRAEAALPRKHIALPRE
jgi:hypothetical protein